MTTPDDLQAQLLADIEGLCRFQRPSASEGEREAAHWVASRFQDAGLEPELEEFSFYPDYWTVWAAHMGLGLAASYIGLGGRRLGALGAILGAATALSFWGDASARFHWLRSLFPARPSYNVLARLRNPDAQGVIVFCAHHDAAHSGLVFHPAIRRRLAARSPEGAEPFPIGRLPFWGLLGATAGSVARALGLGRSLAGAIGWPGRAICGGTALIMANMARSPVSPGAGDNASGVAAVLALARDLAGGPPADTEVWFLSTGCEEGLAGGMKAFLERHHDELDGRRPFFVCLDALGDERLFYATAEGLVTRFPYHPDAIALAQRVTREPEFRDIEPLPAAYLSDAVGPTHHGFPAIFVGSQARQYYQPHWHWSTDVPENVDLAAVERGCAFARRLLEAFEEVSP